MLSETQRSRLKKVISNEYFPVHVRQQTGLDPNDLSRVEIVRTYF